MKRLHTSLLFLICPIVLLTGQVSLNELQDDLLSAQTANDPALLALAHYELGFHYSGLEDQPQTIFHFEQALERFQQLDSTLHVGKCYLNIANAQYKKAAYPEALLNYQRALDLFKAEEFTVGILFANKNMALVYDIQEEFSQALALNRKALEINQEVGDPYSNAEIYNNMAIVKVRQIEEQFLKVFGDFWQDSILLKKYSQRLTLYDSVQIFSDSSLHYGNLVDYPEIVAQSRTTRNQVVLNRGQFLEALNEYQLILKEYSDFISDYDIAVIKNNMAHALMRVGRYAESEDLLTESLDLARTINSNELRMHYFLVETDLNMKRGRYMQALDSYKRYVVFKDSILNAEKLEALKDAEVRYETKAKEQEIESLNRENMLKKRRNQVLMTGIIFITLFLFTAVYLYLLTRKQKERITDQKQEIDDSIQAAKDIQFAALPSPISVNAILEEFFILFRPRDEVSGDFYWISKEAGRTYVLTADCTGHGVPGAFVSMMGFSLIQEMVALYPGEDAGFILNHLRSKLITSFEQAGSQVEGKQSMDVTLCIIQDDRKKMDFAGAMNPLFLYRKGQLTTIKGDRMPIGMHHFDKEPFTNHSIELEKGDTFFTLSDGFVDQFGGPEGKKYTKKRLLCLIQEMIGANMEEIEARLSKELDSWQGDYEQTDDILLIGIRI